MASSYKIILQDSSTGDYLTNSGWSSDIVNAKSFSQTDLDSLPSGSYIQLTIWSIT